MLKVALAEVKAHARRFIAVGIAVMVAVGFLTATLMVNASSEASLANTVGAGFRNADLVIAPGPDAPLEPAAAEAAAAASAATGGVAQTYLQRQAYIAFGAAGTAGFGVLQNLSKDAGLNPAELLRGSWPAAGEVAVDGATAERLQLAEGATLRLAPAGGSVAAESLASGRDLTVSGIIEPSNDPLTMGQPQFLAPDAILDGLSPAEAPAAVLTIQLGLADGADVGKVRDSIAAAVSAAGLQGVAVNTAAEQTKEQVAALTGGSDPITPVLLAFALVAIFVCGLVVANTFSVLVAQRTRDLALLRCIGADRRQIRRSVLVEALLVGALSSAAGVLAAIALMAGLVGWLRQQPDTAFAALAIPPFAVPLGAGAGILMTVLAALAPARAATAVAPLAALRPFEEARAGNRKGRARLWIGLALTAGGAVVLGLGAAGASLLVALPGGLLSFVGLLMCASVFVPPLVSAVGAPARAFGVPGRLAAVNAVRNPGRTSATATALLIGVTLVAMMMTGAQTARTAFDSELATQYPVDVSIAGPAMDGTALDARDAAAAAEYDGVAAAGLVTPGGFAEVDGMRTGVYRLLPEQKRLLQDQTLALDDESVLMAEGSGLKTLTVAGSRGEKELAVVETGSMAFPPLVSAAVAEEIGAPAAGSPDALPQLWLAVDRDLDAADLMQLRADLAAGLGVEEYQLSGAAIERAAFNQVIDVLLLVVTGLLAVAVLIALVGVANTLSLSVLERTRESALLRALGLTRGQLRAMLALEAVLIAGVAALIGIALGVLYGWLGAQSALGAFATVAPDVPWLQLGSVLAVAVIAGLLASVLPARRAARLSPVEGLAIA